MAVVRKAMAALDRLEKSSGLTPEGRDWLITAVDPFHDTDIRPAGYPDIMMAGSVVQLVKQQMTIQCPSSITTGTWDCNIYNAPWLDLPNQVQIFSMGNGGGDILITGAQNLGSFGGLVSAAASTGSNMAPNALGCDYHSLTLSDTYFSGPSRVIAQGFEVTNTTADIYKQGSVTVYRVPQPSRGTRHNHRVVTGTLASPTMQNVVSAEYRQTPPGSLAQASVLLGSRTWDAREGAYVVLTQTESVLRDPMLEPILPMWVDSSQNPPTQCTVPQIAGSPGYQADILATHDYNTGGAFFTGLSLQTTLTVTWNVYIERFPSFAQTDLVTLAQPSPKYDPVALELYSRMLADIPVGVMVKENGLGEWFADVVSTVAPYVQGVLGAIPHPYAQIGAQAAGIAGKAAAKYAAPPNAKGDPLAQEKAKRKRQKAKARGAELAAALKAHKKKG